MYRFCSVINILYNNKSMPNKSNNWNTEKFRRFDATNFGLSIDPSYSGDDPFDFKAGSQHLQTKFKLMKRTINR